MKLDRRIANREIRNRIEDLLREVGLAARCNVRIGNGGDDKVLSGGERKRLAFATEVRIIHEIIIIRYLIDGVSIAQLFNLKAYKGM